VSDVSPQPERTSLWGGRFEGGPAEALAKLSVSVHFDWRLAPYDLLASKAHARVLHRAGLLADDELAAMLGALDELRDEVRSGAFRPRVEDEDVHTALERGLLEKLGTLGGKLRAGRSRNDQVATDLRLYLRDHVRVVVGQLSELEQALVDQAAQHLDTPAPGMTHLQHAQPVLFAHQLLAHVQAFARDVHRLRDWDLRASVSPLGSGALAGSSLPVDPISTAAELGFGSAAPNSMDAVSDRDFVVEFLFCAALLGVHLSRLGEEVVLWNTTEFGWVTLDDAFSTGSSIMPQKKNPDIAELARGKAGRLIGHVTGQLAMLKGLPLTYDRDMQESQEPSFDAVETLTVVLPAMTGMIATMTVHADVLEASAPLGFALATDVAELLVRNGVPFREAHEAVGHLVVFCTVNERELHEVSDAELAHVSPHLTPDIRSVLDVRGAIASRRGHGGTAPERVSEQLEVLRLEVASHREWAVSAPA
jgi:argininosuccinate lyase